MTQDSAAITPTIVERPAQPYVGTRHDVPGDIRKVVDIAFPALFGWIGEHGVQPSGAPLLRLLELDPADGDVRVDTPDFMTWETEPAYLVVEG